MLDCHILHLVAEMANSQVYKIRNNVNVFRIDASELHISIDPSVLSSQDGSHVVPVPEVLGEQGKQVEVIMHSEFFDRVLPNL